MCGITGLISRDRVDAERIRRMTDMLSHRGPDDFGIHVEGNFGLGQTRLGVMDPEDARQPAKNEDGSVLVVFNGEIYNFRQLRNGLLQNGHWLENRSDTAVLPHMYEEYGSDMFGMLNGQFAIAIYDKHCGKLLLARDRFGEKPLYYSLRNGSLCFGSEVKAVLQSGIVDAQISPESLGQVFTFWTTCGDRSIFDGINQLTPGTCLQYENGNVRLQKYWALSFNQHVVENDVGKLVNELDRMLRKSVVERMSADVPVAFYLSGGLDSSLIAGIAADVSDRRLSTYSVEFDDVGFDESEHQRHMSSLLGTQHEAIRFSRDEMAGLVTDVVRHTETPLLRSGSFPMYMLARRVSEDGTKVVLSGEGSDELFGGYDIFREQKIRDFCARQPESRLRPLLYKRVNSFVKGLGAQPAESLSLFYGAGQRESWKTSHASRWRLGSHSLQFFTDEYREQMLQNDAISKLECLLPAEFMDWTSLQRAQYLEMNGFFENYLLSSQGDRISMASGVECRYPFLDYNVADFACSLPDNMKIRGLKEKFIVRKLAERYLPQRISDRKKFPYRAPVNISHLMQDEYVRHMMSGSELDEHRIFASQPVQRFIAAATRKAEPSERDCMLFMGMLTTQILARLSSVWNRKNH